MSERDEPRGRLSHRRGDTAPTSPRRVLVDEYEHLSPVSGRPPFREYLTQLMERRHFIAMQAWSQSTHQHRGTLLGNLWLIIAPMLDALVYFLIFGVILKVSRGMDNFFGYLIIGVFMFTYTTRCVNAAATCVYSNRGMVKAFTFPRASLPIAVVLRETFGTLPVGITMLVMLATVPPHALPTPHWLLVPLVFLLHTMFNLGVAFVVGRIGANLPDMRQLIPYIVRLWFYGSAVMFTIDRFEAIPWMATLVRSNPMYVLLDMYRTLLLDGIMPDAAAWGTAALWSLGFCVLGALFFWRGEVSYGKV